MVIIIIMGVYCCHINTFHRCHINTFYCCHINTFYCCHINTFYCCHINTYTMNHTESYDPRHFTSNCWSAKQWLALPASTTPQVPEIVSKLPLWSGHWAGWKRGLQLAENYADFTGIRITEWLLCCKGKNCKWKLMLSRCVCLVTYRVKSGFGVAECAVVFVYRTGLESRM